MQAARRFCQHPRLLHTVERIVEAEFSYAPMTRMIDTGFRLKRQT